MMVDYSEKTLQLHTVLKSIDTLLLKRKQKDAINCVNDLIVTAIELKQWLVKHETN